MNTVSIVIPVYRCVECLEQLHERIAEVFSKVDAYDFELIFVDDRSPDNAWETIEHLSGTDRRVVGVRLSRNFGQHIAITAGLAEARGDFAVVMDCDLQDPPELLPDLIAQAENGFDIVYTRRRNNDYQPLSRILLNKIYFRALAAITGVSMDGQIGPLSIISRKVIDAFLRVNDKDRHYLLVLHWLGFNSTVLEYDRAVRTVGKSSYGFFKRLQHAMAGLFFHSTRLMVWMMWVGIAVAIVGLFLAIILTVSYLLSNESVPGWTSIVVMQLVLSGFIIISVAIAGIFVARTFEQTRQRPLYLVDECKRLQ